MKTSQLIINDGNIIILPYEGLILRRLKNKNKTMGGIYETGFKAFRTKNKFYNYQDVIYEKFYGINLKDFEFVSHKNGDILDNRIDNLEVSVNCYGKNKVKHIYFSKKKNCYEIRIHVDCIKQYFGYYNDINNAIARRNEVYDELDKLGLHYNK